LEEEEEVVEVVEVEEILNSGSVGDVGHVQQGRKVLNQLASRSLSGLGRLESPAKLGFDGRGRGVPTTTNDSPSDM